MVSLAYRDACGVAPYAGKPDVIIALLDTGVNPHPDLEGKLVPGWNFYDNTTNPQMYTGISTP